MPNISVTEKAHWRDRIAARLDKKIESLAAAVPGLMDRIKREARQCAIASLGLAALQADIDAVIAARRALDQREEQAERGMLAIVRGVAVADLDDCDYGYSERREVESALFRRAAAHEDELLAADDIGRHVLRLRQEKENLLDTVWIATSPAHIKQLWCKVNQLLGVVPTHLERAALDIEAPKEFSCDDPIPAGGAGGRSRDDGPATERGTATFNGV